MTGGLLLGWLLLSAALAAAWTLYRTVQRHHIAQLAAREQQLRRDLEALRIAKTRREFDDLITRNFPAIPTQRRTEDTP